MVSFEREIFQTLDDDYIGIRYTGSQEDRIDENVGRISDYFDIRSEEVLDKQYWSDFILKCHKFLSIRFNP